MAAFDNQGRSHRNNRRRPKHTPIICPIQKPVPRSNQSLLRSSYTLTRFFSWAGVSGAWLAPVAMAIICGFERSASSPHGIATLSLCCCCCCGGGGASSNGRAVVVARTGAGRVACVGVSTRFFSRRCFGRGWDGKRPHVREVAKKSGSDSTKRRVEAAEAGLEAAIATKIPVASMVAKGVEGDTVGRKKAPGSPLADVAAARGGTDRRRSAQQREAVNLSKGTGRKEAK